MFLRRPAKATPLLTPAFTFNKWSQEFTAEELSQALQSAMTTLNIDPSPPSKPVTADEFKTAFGNAVTALHQQVHTLKVPRTPHTNIFCSTMEA